MKLEPGLWKATVRGVPGESIVMVGDDGNSTFSLDGEGNVRRCYVFTDARPLIILDPDDPTVTAFVKVYAGSPGGGMLNKIANLIAEQTKPARIEEPGQWGLVNAMVFGRRSPETFLHDGTKWRGQKTASGVVTNWDSLIDPVLVREGVTS